MKLFPLLPTLLACGGVGIPNPLPATEAESGVAKITVYPGIVRVIENGPFEARELERERYFRSYHSLGQYSGERHAELVELGAEPGRGTFRFYLEPDPDGTSTFSEESIETSLNQREKVYRRAGQRGSHLEHAIAHGHYPDWMRVGDGKTSDGAKLEDWERQASGNILRSDLYEPVADVLVKWYDAFKEKDLHYPVYYTVQNEPLVSWPVESFARYTRIVAERMEAAHPDVLVAGPCLAWPYPTGDWSMWNQWQSRFIELAGDAVDAYDLHFYSKGHWALPPDDYWQSQRKESPFLFENRKQGNLTVWDHGRLTAYLDLWNAHHLRTWDGETKPMIISEFGRQTIHPQFGPWINDFWPWLYMNTVTRMWMEFMDRPEIQLTIPFVLGESDLGYAPARGQAIYTRLNEENQRELAVTRFRDFFAFFRDLEGNRIAWEVDVGDDSNAMEALRVLPLRSGNRIYLLIHNGGGKRPLKVHLGALLGDTRVEAKAVGVKRMYYEGSIPDPADNESPAPGTLHIADTDEYEPMTSPEIELRGEETIIVRMDFEDTLPRPSIDRREIRMFSKDTIVDFAGSRLATASITLPDALPENLVAAKLHLGLARQGGFDQDALVAFNGTILPEIDLAHSLGVADYHAPSVVEVPLDALRTGENEIQVAFRRRLSGGVPYLASLRLDLVVHEETAAE